MKFGEVILGIVAIMMIPMIGNCKPHTKQLRIGVIDTGLNLNDSRLKDHLCKTGHKDFSGEGLVDLNGHGTHIVGIIEENAGDGNYCLVIYKYYSSSKKGAPYNTKHEIDAIAEAVKNKLDIVNFSGGGGGYVKREYDLIRSHPKTTFVVAAGNDGHDLDRDCNYYPACYLSENIVVVGNLSQDGVTLMPHSNYGRALGAVEIGDDVLSTLPGGKMGRNTGTSMSAAVHTGKLIREMLDAK